MCPKETETDALPDLEGWFDKVDEEELAIAQTVPRRAPPPKPDPSASRTE